MFWFEGGGSESGREGFRRDSDVAVATYIRYTLTLATATIEYSDHHCLPSF